MNEKSFRVDKKRLEALMELRGYTNRSLADKLGQHYNTITRLKSEESTTFSNVERLCEALDCSPLDLIVVEGFPAPFLASSEAK